ncbi:MAG: PTS sugar transporter subunit IIA [Candidatus Sumerlaeia bacterium]|nr:PTS sugar transporter subunit IIA [Candidatus Sumerlaeia bacterium]
MAIEPRKYFSPDRVAFLETDQKDSALKELVSLLAKSPHVKDPVELLAKIYEREKTLSTGVGQGLALPHVKIGSIEDFVLSVGISRKGIEFDSLDGKPAHILVMIGCHESQAGQYMQMLSKLVRSLKEAPFRQRLLDCKTPKAVFDILTGPDGIN